MTNLTSLELYGDNITDDGIKHLTNLTYDKSNKSQF